MNYDISRLNEQMLSRRQVTMGAALGGAALAFGRWIPNAGAQAIDLTSLGYATLDVTIAADGFSGIPETLAAGRYLLNARAEDLEGEGIVSFLSPFEMSAEVFLGFFGGGEPPASPEADAAAEGEPRGRSGGGIPNVHLPVQVRWGCDGRTGHARHRCDRSHRG